MSKNKHISKQELQDAFRFIEKQDLKVKEVLIREDVDIDKWIKDVRKWAKKLPHE